MPISRRRRLAIAALLVASLVIAGATALVGLAADTERIDGYWVSATLTDDGLEVVEVIDYDFGPNPRRGIFRRVPDMIAGTATASSPTAPDEFTVTDYFIETEIRIGDPFTTITGRHRYRIEYTLERDAVLQNGFFSWNAVGLDWTVPIENVEVFLATPGGLEAVDCRQGTPWDERDCAAGSTETGAVSVAVASLSAGDAVTVSGEPGAGGAPRLPAAPTGPADDPGVSFLVPAAIVLAMSLVGGLVATFVVRRAGRERVWTGGAADAAFGEAEDGLGSRRIDEKRLADLATIEFEPPGDMSAVEGGLLLQERVRDEHLSAWLLESAIRGEVDLSGASDTVLSRGSSPAHPSVHQILDRMFVGRDRIELDSYDPSFSKGWSALENELKDWLHGSAHWDEAGRRRRTLVIIGAILGFVAAAAVGGIATAMATRNGLGALAPVVALGGLGVGAAVGALASSYELLVRTEAGSALWLRIESFRRFLENSEARHVTEAAEKGVLRHYTAWAVALGESRAWTRSVESAAEADPALRSSIGRDLMFLHVGSTITSAAKTASTAPSSSGSGGGFSGGAGGGGGGGGGGSW